MPKPLKPGDDIRCPHCQRWHAIHQRHIEGTAYTSRMLYFVCCDGYYYAGQLGATSRHATRALGPPTYGANRHDSSDANW